MLASAVARGRRRAPAALAAAGPVVPSSGEGATAVNAEASQQAVRELENRVTAAAATPALSWSSEQEAAPSEAEIGTATLPVLDDYLLPVISAYPGGLGQRDGETGLYPFMLASASAASAAAAAKSGQEGTKRGDGDADDDSNGDGGRAALSVVYHLLRKDPSLVTSGGKSS